MTIIAGRVQAVLNATVTDTRELAGGEIGTAVRCDLADGRSVVAKMGPTPLDAEARSLRRLADAGLPTPEIYFADPDLLVLEFVPGVEWSPAAERALGEAVARLHGTTRATYGSSEKTWKGRLELPNEERETWPAFFGANRLRPTADAARDADGIDAGTHDCAHALADRLDDFLPHSPSAALLHGDLWTGNAIPGESTVRAFLDPAPWYGDPAVDVAYAEWCGVSGAFRHGYESVRPLAIEDARQAVYELLFALDHAFHFPDEAYGERAVDRLDDLLD